MLIVNMLLHDTKNIDKLFGSILPLLTFAISKIRHQFFAFGQLNCKDNTPSRLAAMQHTWEVFSFYPITHQSRMPYENL